jgi:hypothetical protein
MHIRKLLCGLPTFSFRQPLPDQFLDDVRRRRIVLGHRKLQLLDQLLVHDHQHLLFAWRRPGSAPGRSFRFRGFSRHLAVSDSISAIMLGPALQQMSTFPGAHY